MPTGPVIIKKYENRRLYDSSNSRYVNLEDIAQMVREGTEVLVVDAATGEDLTRFVLTQIVVGRRQVSELGVPAGYATASGCCGIRTSQPRGHACLHEGHG